jgi:hypothetical protein
LQVRVVRWVPERRTRRVRAALRLIVRRVRARNEKAAEG